jgi:hypothetical protein
MAHLWRATENGWQPVAVDGAGCALDARLDLMRPPGGAPGPDSSSAILLRRTPGDRWVLLARPGSPVLVNGLPAALGIASLADRDEIRLPPSAPIYFSTERLAEIVSCPPGTAGVCPRCKNPVAPGDDAVRCPGCGLWHHASSDRPCWSYADSCAACPQPTSTGAGYQWTPERL